MKRIYAHVVIFIILLVSALSAKAFSYFGTLYNPATATAAYAPNQYTDATGTGDAILASYPNASPTLIDGYRLTFGVSAVNATTTPTFTPTLKGVAQTTRTIVKMVNNVGVALVAGDIQGIAEVYYDLPNLRWVLNNPANPQLVMTTPVSGVSPLVYWDGSVLKTDSIPSHLGYNATTDTVNLSALYVSAASTVTATVTNTGAQSTTAGGGILTGANPSAAIASGNRIGYTAYFGTTDAVGTTYNSAAVTSFATQAWSGTAGGSSIALETTPSNTLTRSASFTCSGGAASAVCTVGTASSGVLAVPLGTSAAPSINFGGSATTGFFSASANAINTNNSFTVSGQLAVLTLVNAGNGKLTMSYTAPTITSGFGTTPTIVNNGTAAFTITVGTGGTASSGVIGLPAASTGWNCAVTPAGAPQAAAVTYAASTSTTSVTLTNYTLTTGAALAWTAGQVLNVHCFGR